MTDPADLPNLARLDDAETVKPDPQIWSANLAALGGQQPELAARLEHTTLPAHWRPVRALDGFATCRVEPSGKPAQWLADTAAPLARADGLLAGFNPGDRNPSLPAIAAGAELHRLLERLPHYRAVYVFDTELTALAAVLRSLPLAPAISSGRCILVPPGQEQPFLQEYLTNHPGLLPPGNIVCLPGVAPERLDEIRQICERSNHETNQDRNRRLNELGAALASAPPPPATTPRLAVLALTPDPTSRRVSAELEQAAGRSGWTAVRCGLDGPRSTHLLPHCETLAGLSPTLTLCVKHPREQLPLPLPGTVCQWVTDAADLPGSLPEDDVLRLAASPRVASALRAAAPTGARIAEWYWGCEAGEPGETPAPDEVVLLLADLPDDSPAACGIEQPSHKEIWKLLRHTAARRWETHEILEPEALLRHAERTTGVHLGEPAVREGLLHRIERALIPTAVLRRIVQVLSSEPMRIQAVGRGWQRGSGKEIETLAESVFDLPDRGVGLHPRAAIFAGALDPLTPTLLRAGALGWPLLIHSPGRRPLTAALGHVLHPEQHFLPFADGADLRRALQAIRNRPGVALRRAARTRQHLRDNHSYQRRLEQLANLIQDRPPHSHA